MTSLSSWSILSKIQAILAHNFFMKDPSHVNSWFLHDRFHPRSKPFCSSSSLQIIEHISSCPSRLASTTSCSILSMIQVVLDHNFCMKVEALSSSFSWTPIIAQTHKFSNISMLFFMLDSLCRSSYHSFMKCCFDMEMILQSCLSLHILLLYNYS